MMRESVIRLAGSKRYARSVEMALVGASDAGTHTAIVPDSDKGKRHSSHVAHRGSRYFLLRTMNGCASFQSSPIQFSNIAMAKRNESVITSMSNTSARTMILLRR
jgi:hypothetical protein